jgi:hypothetical protein
MGQCHCKLLYDLGQAMKLAPDLLIAHQFSRNLSPSVLMERHVMLAG